MVLNTVICFHKVEIKITGRDQTPSKMVYFYEQWAITPDSMCNMDHYQT